jgi:hypothetical protein
MKAICLALALCINGAAAAGTDPDYTQALQDYRAGRWSSAFGRMIPLANNGNVEAARIALFMQQHGRLLYNSDWEASEEDIELWSKMTGVRPPGQVERVASNAAVKGPGWRPRMTRFITRSDPPAAGKAGCRSVRCN